MALSSSSLTLRVLPLSALVPGLACVGSAPEHLNTGLNTKLRELLARHDLSAGDSKIDAFFESLDAYQDPGISLSAQKAEGGRPRRSVSSEEKKRDLELEKEYDDFDPADLAAMGMRKQAYKNRQASLMNFFEGQGVNDDDPAACKGASGGCTPAGVNKTT